jgi:hypothetical protein
VYSLLGLLTAVQSAVSPTYFYTCLWQTVAAVDTVRQPALLLVAYHYDRTRHMDDQLWLMGAHMDTLVSALCACADDSSALVQRHLLDLVTNAFPLHSQLLVRADNVRLVRAALFVVLKRDMSLNRRLYSWWTGQTQSALMPVDTQPLDVQYLRQHALPLINQAVEEHLRQAFAGNGGGGGGGSARRGADATVRVLRVLVHLLDRADIGQCVLDTTLVNVLAHATRVDSPVPSDLINNINLLLSTVEPAYIWRYLADQSSTAFRSDHFVTIHTVVQVRHLYTGHISS